MGEVVQFVSRAAKTAEHNLGAFVKLARDELTAFSEGGAWDGLTWRNDRSVSVVFCKYRPRSEARKAPIPLAEPFLTFAKAYLRYRYSHRPVKSLAVLLLALRMIERALIQANGRADILDLNTPALNLSARLCAELRSNKTAQYQRGGQIEAVADFCRQHGLVAGLPSWKSPFKKPPTLTETLTEEGTQHRDSKMPANHQMLALADLFAKADDIETRYFTSIAVLMMVAPSRISEVYALGMNCIGWDNEAGGEPQMYLRWRAAKGGGAGKKWVPAPMRDVVKEAIARLTTIGASARKTARFAHENPGRFMRHRECTTPTDFGEDDELTQSQVAAAIGLKSTTTPTWTRLPPTWGKWAGKGPITYRVLAEITAKLYQGPHWPYINANREVKTWEALCVIREAEYDRVKSVRPFSWKLLGTGEINDRLGRREEFSMFERAGMKNPDGLAIKLTTHQLRHWLSTIAIRKGMDDYTLAQWAGRTRIEDNAHYDHRTERERYEEIQALVPNKELNTLEKYRGGRPVTFMEVGIDHPGVTKVTLYGRCGHNWAAVPCQKQRKCMACKAHRWIKGDHITLERVRKHETMLLEQLKNRTQVAAKGLVFGADRWVDDAIWELALTRTMRKMLESEEVPDGTVLSIPGEYDPSPVRRALMDRGLIDAPSLDDIPVKVVYPVLEAPKSA